MLTVVLNCVCQCDVLVEQYEEVIEEWYKGSQEEDLTTYLCEKHVLKGQDTGNMEIQMTHSIFHIISSFALSVFYCVSFLFCNLPL